MREVGIKGGEVIAINTDAQDLLYAKADQKILIGREISKGLGAGSNPRIGQEAAKEQQQEFSQRGGIAVTDNIPKYWALNDVSTYWFIRGEVYRKMRGNEKARKAYQEIVDNYNYGRY